MATREQEEQFKAELRQWLGACSAASGVGIDTERLMERGNYLWLGSRAVGFDEKTTIGLLGPGLEALRLVYEAEGTEPQDYGSLLREWNDYRWRSDDLCTRDHALRARMAEHDAVDALIEGMQEFGRASEIAREKMLSKLTPEQLAEVDRLMTEGDGWLDAVLKVTHA